MAFLPGHTKIGGRVKGVPNKRTQEARSILEANNFCPLTAMMDIHKIAMTKFVEEVDKEDSGRISPMESNAATYLKIAADKAADLAAYAFPKLKSIEQTKANPLEGMTIQEKLEAARQFVKLLEEQAKDPSGAL